jgi:predicted transcriptional regulator
MARRPVLVGEKASKAAELLRSGIPPQRVADAVGVSRGAVLDFVASGKKSHEATAGPSEPSPELKINAMMRAKLVRMFNECDDPTECVALSGRIARLNHEISLLQKTTNNEAEERASLAADRVRERLRKLEENSVATEPSAEVHGSDPQPIKRGACGT